MKKSKVSHQLRHIFFLFFFSFCAQANTFTDTLMSGVIKSHQANTAYITWTMQGKLFWFNHSDQVVLQKDYVVDRIKQVISNGEKVYLLASKVVNGKIDSVLSVNNKGNIVDEWTFSDAIISMNVSKDDITVIVNNQLIKLNRDGKKQVLRANFNADYIIGKINNNPILCTKPNLQRTSFKNATCSRKGIRNWEITGQWRDANKPIWCGDYLIENGFYRKFSKYRFIKISSTLTGKEIYRKKIYMAQVISCNKSNFLFSGNGLFLAQSSNLDIIKKINVKNLPIWSAIFIKGAIIYIDGIGQLHRTEN